MPILTPNHGYEHTERQLTKCTTQSPITHKIHNLVTHTCDITQTKHKRKQHGIH